MSVRDNTYLHKCVNSNFFLGCIMLRLWYKSQSIIIIIIVKQILITCITFGFFNLILKAVCIVQMVFNAPAMAVFMQTVL